MKQSRKVLNAIYIRNLFQGLFMPSCLLEQTTAGEGCGGTVLTVPILVYLTV